MTEPMLRPEFAALTVYRRDDTPVTWDLSDNTNLFGSAPSALASLATWAGRSPSRYPTAGADRLRTALGDWLGVGPDHIVVGCGSNDMLDAAMRAFGVPGTPMAVSVPTFVMATHFGIANSLRILPVPTRPDGDLDVDALLATGAPLIYLATPNNPSGRAATPERVMQLLDRAPGIVILDEAYTEYLGSSWAPVAAARPNVVVTRTFSKAWGLAGLRIGYAVGSVRLVDEIAKARGPYKLNAVAEQGASAAVEEDRAWLDGVVRETRAARDRLTSALVALGYSPLRSDANFVSVPVPDAAAAARALAERGVAVRATSGRPVLGDLLRITVGPPPAMAALLEALEALPR